MEFGSSGKEIKCNGDEESGVTCMDRVKNEEVRRRTGVTRFGWLSNAVC